MYRILIVEDDDIIRKGLVKIISKMDIPVDTLFEAGNGQEALDLISKISPDIVITDIKMPSISGLDLIRQIRANNCTIKFIILSGYNEFSFAQEAISLGVSDYLLKPVKKDKLYSSLQSIILHLDEEKRAAEQDSIKEVKFKKYKSIVLREVLQEHCRPSAIFSTITDAGIEFTNDGFAVMSIFCNSNPDIINEFLKIIIKQTNIATSYLSKYNHMICLLNISNSDFLQLNSIISTAARDYAFRQKILIYTGISEWTGKLNLLHDLVIHAEYALDYRVLDDSNYVFFYSDNKKCTIQKSALDIYYEAVLNAVNTKNVKDISNSINNLISHLSNNEITPKILKDSLEDLWICYILPKYKDMIKNKPDIDELYQSCQSICDLKIKVKQSLYNIIKYEEAIENNNFSVKINAAIKYINNNYNKDLSLDEVASYIKINTSYFSSVFKKNTGMNFINYLNKIRIEKSKALLRNPQYKVYEIAQMVGFCDEKYYYKVFKNHTGITPNQYRDTASSH